MKKEAEQDRRTLLQARDDFVTQWGTIGTAWGINRLAYGFGLGGYGNPYCDEGGGGGGYDYSQPIDPYQPVADSQPAATTDAAAAGSGDRATRGKGR